MRLHLSFLVAAAFTGVLADDIILSYDKKLDGLVESHEVVTTMMGMVDSVPQTMGGPEDGYGDRAVKVQRSPGMSPRAALDMLRGRASSCAAGYGYCNYAGGCCPSQDKCCSYGYCLRPGEACCPRGPCGSGKTCCGYSHCMPIGAACCSDEGHCPAGNSCYLKSGRIVCCTNSYCTAYVSENGVTSTASSRTSTTTYYTTRTQYYYWTITWYYYYYYWTYIAASKVTSSRRTTYTTLSIYTTDATAASRYFTSVSRTLSFSAPASATSLASLAGKTASPTSEPGDNGNIGGSVGDSGGSSNSDGGSSGGGAASSASRSFMASIDRGLVSFLLVGATIGVVAVAL